MNESWPQYMVASEFKDVCIVEPFHRTNANTNKSKKTVHLNILGALGGRHEPLVLESLGNKIPSKLVKLENIENQRRVKDVKGDSQYLKK